MSYKQCIFGVPTASLSRELLIDNLNSYMTQLSSDVELPDVYALISPEEEATRTGLRLFMLGTDGPRRGGTMIARGFLVESLRRFEDIILAVCLYDDQNGVFMFNLNQANTNAFIHLLSDGCYLGGDLDAIEFDYPQKSFSREELQGFNKKDPSELTDAEYLAVAEYKDALSLGLAQFFPNATRAGCLDLLYAKEALVVYRADDEDLSGARCDKPQNWCNMMAFWPEPVDWMWAGMKERHY